MKSGTCSGPIPYHSRTSSGPISVKPLRACCSRTCTFSVAHWNMSRSPVKISAFPPARSSASASECIRSSASSPEWSSTFQPSASYSPGAFAHCEASPSGIGGRSAW